MKGATISSKTGTKRSTLVEVLLYAILVLASAFVGPLLAGSPQSPGLGFILWAIAPLGVSLGLRLSFKDWPDLGLAPGFRRNGGWYVLSVIAVPAIMGLSVVLGAQLSVVRINQFRLFPYLGTALQALPFFFLFSVFEEFGWRGFLSPKLAKLGVNSPLVYLLTSVVWATWHLPFIRDLTWVYSSESIATFLPRFYLSMFVYSVLYGELRVRTGSVWAAVLVHACANAFGHPLMAEYITTSRGLEVIGSASDGVITIAMVAALGVILLVARKKAKPTHS